LICSVNSVRSSLFEQAAVTKMLKIAAANNCNSFIREFIFVAFN